MPISYTRSDVVNQAVSELLGAEGQTPSDDNVATVDKLFDGVVAELSALDIYTVDDPGLEGPTGGSIEAAAFRSLSYVLANSARSSFSDLGNPEVEAKAQDAMNKLRTIAASPRTRRTLEVESALIGRRRGLSYSEWSRS